MDWTVSQINSIAPDSSSFTAGEKLAKGTWQETGRSGRALWGAIKGSGSNPYQVRIDLIDFAYHCSCPSRKLPCKHVLALLFLMVNSPDKVSDRDEPEGVNEWLAARAERAEKKEKKKAAEAIEVTEFARAAESTESAEKKGQDREAGDADSNNIQVESDIVSQQIGKKSGVVNKRTLEREKRVSDGVDQLILWLEDIMRSGIASLTQHSFSFWEDESRRLVDSQAPGLAAWVQAIGNHFDDDKNNGNTSLQMERVYGELGRLALLLEAWKKREKFSDDFQKELRQAMGWTVYQSELELVADRCTDRWALLGQSYEETDKIRTQRNWFYGFRSHRYFLYLQFAVGNRAEFSEIFVPGTFRDGESVFWPGTSRIRGKFLSSESLPVNGVTLPEESAETIPDFLNRYAEALARWPWTERVPVLLTPVFVRPLDSEDKTWYLYDQEGRSLPVQGHGHWLAAAITYTQPLTVFGEWNGKALQLLSVWYGGSFRFSLNRNGD